jgi:ubiquinone/menaquinone biosynthesis C-methylase UbiE
MRRGAGPGSPMHERCRLAELTCVEIDSELARRFEQRLAGPNVSVICGGAASMPVDGDSFDSVVCFTMLHHVPSIQLQNQVLAEALRVLDPGRIFARGSSDSPRLWVQAISPSRDHGSPLHMGCDVLRHLVVPLQITMVVKFELSWVGCCCSSHGRRLFLTIRSVPVLCRGWSHIGHKNDVWSTSAVNQ